MTPLPVHLVLPLLVDEKKIFAFKFWFNGTIQDGMSYQQELFCRLQTWEIRYRAKVYRLGCKICKDDTPVAIALSDTTCSLWVSLRSPLVKATLVDGVPLDLANLDTPLNEGET